MQKIIPFKFGPEKPSLKLYVYLHGAGEFGVGPEGQDKYPGFCSLLKSGELCPSHPFIFACALDGEIWEADSLDVFIEDLKNEYKATDIHLIGYSRGGEGVYNYINNYSSIESATVINSRVPNAFESDINVGVIHSKCDQITPIEEVRRFVANAQSKGLLVSLTEWNGDHYSIEDIARYGIAL
jgi:predicted peptidase